MIKKDNPDNEIQQVQMSVIKQSIVEVTNVMDIEKPSLKIEQSEEVKLDFSNKPKGGFNFDALEDMDDMMMDGLGKNLQSI